MSATSPADPTHLTPRETPDGAGVRVLLVAAAAPTRTALEPALQSLADAGARVDALWLNPPDAAVLRGLPLAGHRRLVLTRRSGSGTPTRWSPRGLADAVTYRLLRAANRRSSADLRVLRAARRDPSSRALVRDADVVVALDRRAIYPVWRLTRRRRPAFYGLPAAVRYVTAGA